MAESFFASLKNERVYRTVYATKTQARSDVINYIEGFYNSRRRHSGISYCYPNDVHQAGLTVGQATRREATAGDATAEEAASDAA